MSDTLLRIDATEFSRRLQEVLRGLPVAADRLLGRVALKVEAEAKPRTPFKSGALKASIGSAFHGGGHEPPMEAGGKQIPRFGLEPRSGEAYVYATMSYAAEVHEHLGRHHDVGGPKFIENALKAVGPREMRASAAEIMRGLS